jgi:type I restriction enzyme S subunit
MMERWELPKGWEWKKVGEVAQDTERRNPSLRPDESFSYVDIAAIDNKNYCIRLECVKKIKGKDAPSRARKVIHANDVIFATTRPYLKNIAIVPQALDNQICSTGFCVLRAKPGMAIPKYLFFAVFTNSFIHQLTPKGANYPAVNDSDIYQAIIPIPYPDDPARSLAEQRRIVARLELLLGETRAMRDDIDAMRRDLAQVMESVLAEVFPNPNGELPKGWEWRRLGDICKTTSGGTPKRNVAGYYGGTIPWLKSGELDDGLILRTEETITEKGLNESNAKIFPKGTLLIALYGATVGKLGILGIDAATNQAICAIFPSHNVENTFLFWFLRAIRQKLLKSSFGGAQPNISQEIIRNLEVPIPYPDDPACSLAEQRRIVAYLEHIAEEIRAMDDLLAQDLRDIEVLEQSILAAAFRGEV